MATRQDFQIAQDLVRFVNIVNDLIDVTSFMMRELDHDGAPLVDKYGDPYTFQMIKDGMMRARQNILNYWSMIDVFMTTYGATNVANALNCVGVSATNVKQELDNIKDVINYVSTNMVGLTTKTELLPLADYIDTNVSKLPLVRRSWCLGI
jgi:hypothetical protein